MKNFILAVTLTLFSVFATGQPLAGIKTIPGDYTTLQNAFRALNSNGVGTGGVVFNVAPGHTETLAHPDSGRLSATGTSADQILFRRTPGIPGQNPKVISSLITATSSTNGVIKIEGGDYITFSGIDVAENPSNTLTTRMTEWGYALVKRQNSTPFDGCQYVTIRNCTITLNKTNTNSVGIYTGNHVANATAALTITAPSDACNYCRFDSNNISNVYSGIKLNGYSAASPYLLFDHHNEIGEFGKNVIYDFGGSSTVAYGIYATNQDSIRVVNDSIVGGNNTAQVVAGIYLQNGVNSSAFVRNNYISVTRSASGGGNLYGIWNAFGGTPLQNTIEISGNSIIDCYHPATSTGNLYGIYNTGGAGDLKIFDNLIDGSTLAGTAEHYGVYSSPTGTVQSIYDNQIRNLENTGTGKLVGIYTGSFTTTNTYANHLLNFNANGGTVYGIQAASGANINLYGNDINGLSSNNGSTASSLVYGIYQVGGTNIAIYNNFITDLAAGDATNNPSLCGLYLAGGTAIKCYYNTVYLNAESTGTTFGSAALYASTTPTLDFRNNILVNTSGHGATGHTVAFRRGTSTSLTSYASTSNNNCFHAGTPGSNNLIFYNVNWADQTIGDFKLRVAPRDALSFSEIPPFADTVAPAIDVHIQTNVPSFCEGGASTITTPAITTDMDGDDRYPNPGYPDHPSYPASAPDVGADEFGGIRNDLTPPVISYQALKNTSVTGNRTLTATITDIQSGVPTTSPGLPVLYWKINDAAAWNSATGSSLGGGQYQFTFGNGAILADVVYYFICAQDGFLSPNAGASPPGGAGGFSINPPACSTPPATPNAYRIVGTLAAGNYLVGGSGNTPCAACSYVDLTQAFADMNNVVDHIEVMNGGTGYGTFSTYAEITGGGGSGAEAQVDVNGEGVITGIRLTKSGNGYYKAPDVIITGIGTGGSAVAVIGAGKEILGHVNIVVDTSYNPLEENDFPVVLHDVVGTGPAKTITLKPAPYASPILESYWGAACLKLNGVDYVTIDGSNNGSSSRNMVIRALNAALNCAAVWIASPSAEDGATHNTVKNCMITGSGAGTSNYAGIFSGSSVSIESTYPALAPNSENTFENNLLQWARNGIVCLGKSTAEPDEGLSILNNVLGTDTAGQGFTNQGIFVENQASGDLIGNEIQNVLYNSQYTWVTGIYVSNCRSMNISANRIHNLQQTASGVSFWVDGIYQTCGAFSTSGNPSANLYANNVVYDLHSTGASSYYNVIGIHNVKGWGDQYYYNTVNLSGQLNQFGLSNGSPSACFANGLGVNSASAGNLEMKNNIFYINSHNPSGTNHHYAHYAAVTSYAGSALDYNCLLDSVTGTAIGHLGYYNSTNHDDITQWRSATAQDPNSISTDPLLTSDTDMIPVSGSPVFGAGTPVPGVLTDLTGAPRDPVNPSIGAYENSAFTGKQWNGSVSSAWDEAANWTPSGVPLGYHPVLIPQGTPYPCVVTDFGSSCISLMINPGATLTINNASELTIYGDITILNGAVLNNNGTLDLGGNLVNLNQD